MIVNGILRESVTVEVSKEELFLGLAKELGIASLFQENYGEYAVLEDVQTNDGTKPAIVIYRDDSYHGSSHYKQYSKKNLTEYQYEYAKAMLEIKKTMKKEKIKKEMDELNL